MVYQICVNGRSLGMATRPSLDSSLVLIWTAVCSTECRAVPAWGVRME